MFKIKLKSLATQRDGLIEYLYFVSSAISSILSSKNQIQHSNQN